MGEYLWVALLFPLGAAAVIGCFGARMSARRSATVGCLTAGGALVVSWGALWEWILLPDPERVRELVFWPWVRCGDLTAPIGFLFDPLSLTMLLIICAASFLIHLYSVEFMPEDEGSRRVLAGLNLSVFFLLTLVSANNFLLMYAGWEGVGLGTAWLIGAQRRCGSALSGADRALVAGRVTDCGLLLAVFLIAVTFGSLDLAKVLPAAAGTLRNGGIAAAMLALLIVVAACGKSAQVPLSVWLSAAREAPMPALALVHGVTVATAGAYLLVRCSVFFVLAPLSLWALAGVGAASAVWAAAISATQVDVRQVLGYLAISQVGYVFLACGAGANPAALLQLLLHVCAVSLLVLGAGSVAAALAGETDIRAMGALRPRLPWTYLCFVLAALSLAGVAPLSGFLSKGLVLEAALHTHRLLYAAGVVASLLTAFSLFRAVFLVFGGKHRPVQHSAAEAKESVQGMVFSLLVLAALAAVGGWVAMPASWGGGEWLQHFLASTVPAGAGPGGLPSVPGMMREWVVSAVLLGSALLGIGLAYLLYVARPNLPAMIAAKLAGLHGFFIKGWYLDAFYDAFLVEPFVRAAERLRCRADRVVAPGAPSGVNRACLRLGEKVRAFHDGPAAHWGLVMGGGILLLVIYVLLP
jgi:NADH-quinone oxidoreductase subunit L